VLETIKEDRTVYRREVASISRRPSADPSCGASPRCFGAMAPLGARLIGQELHSH